MDFSLTFLTNTEQRTATATSSVSASNRQTKVTSLKRSTSSSASSAGESSPPPQTCRPTGSLAKLLPLPLSKTTIRQKEKLRIAETQTLEELSKKRNRQTSSALPTFRTSVTRTTKVFRFETGCPASVRRCQRVHRKS